jgi:hypothetical protein
MMNEIFADLIAEGIVCVYLDQVLIFTKTLKDHIRVTPECLRLIRRHKLYLKSGKVRVYQNEH